MAMNSPVFEAMLYGPMAEKDTLSLDDDQPEAFKCLLDFIYTDNINFTEVKLTLQVYRLAHKYQLDKICQICSENLAEEITEENFPFVYDTALFFDDHKLLQRCEEVLITAADQVLKSKNITFLRSSSLKQLLSHPRLAVSSEANVFSALLSWGLSQVKAEYAVGPVTYLPVVKKESPKSISAKEDENEKEEEAIEKHQYKEEMLIPKLRQVVEEFLPLVRFLTMTAEEFIQHVIPSGIVAVEEGVNILQGIEGMYSTLPKFVSSLAAKKRYPSLITSLVLSISPMNNGTSINFKYYTKINHYLLQNFQTTKAVLVVKISSAFISSLNEGVVTVNDSNGEIGKGTWRGTACHFKRPIKLVPGVIYNFELNIEAASIAVRNNNINVSQGNDVTFVGTTSCLHNLEIEYITEN
ncbi:BTB/POZ domain-containing protein 6-like 5 [Homarus americanus]|uniref:BTB/POZ domain-containing protein 6-like 5 n=2 Tax=Homarus americanus TaxID=6706 RepID=A0A8J5MUE7_HOMAM|nr:BTB/POZ domain-containing protein 6-like 5 [Homarus americanus]